MSSCGITGQVHKKNSTLQICPYKEIQCLKGTKYIEVITNRGKIIFELDGESSPLTSGNFLDLANRGVYNGTIFHRVIKSPMPFIVQGGDPLSKNIKANKNLLGTGNFIDPKKGNSRFIPLEIKLKNEDSPRYNQLLTNQDQFRRIQLMHVRGSLAMARSESMGSASSQFYIVLRDLPELDGRYSVFGKVVKGMDIVDKIKEGDYILRVKNKVDHN
ncbi:peptidylprolyl isomerase [Prochlorococcus marinus]|uniref:peptidylprolyl isomerase n=1 Tax=Prochlorococcus marinus TaxID=1219 RepID=UPI001CECEAA8|nr:peptidylprolyl isomerase [Prochlorococcus marinus]